MQIYRAIKYIRLSYTDDKTVESNSVANQRKLIDDFIAKHDDIEVVAEKVDDGYSGVLYDRPAFTEMMELIKQGKANCVIVKDLSRLGREYIETGRYLRRVFPAYGVRFIAINDNFDTLNEKADELSVSIKNIMNEEYSRDISVKTRSALDIKRRNGDFVGAFTVYGYLKTGESHKSLVIDPFAANVVRDIFRKADIYRFRCIANDRICKGACVGVTLSENELTEAVCAGIKDIIGKLAISSAECSAFKRQKAQLTKSISEYQSELEKVLSFVRNLYENFVEGIISNDEYISFKSNYSEKAANLKEKITTAKRELSQIEDTLQKRELVAKSTKTFMKNGKLTAELISLFVKRIEVTPDGSLPFPPALPSCRRAASRCGFSLCAFPWR